MNQIAYHYVRPVPKFWLCALAVLGIGVAPGAFAQVTNTNYWTNTVSGVWSGAANWSNGVPISDINTALEFDASGTNRYAATNDFAGNFLLNQLLLNSGSTATQVLAGNGLTFSQTGAARPQLLQNNTGQFLVSNAVILGANTTFGGTGSGDVRLAGAITGAGNLIMTGSNYRLILGASNSYNGQTLISNGVVNVQNSFGLGASNVGATVSSGAALELQGGITITNKPLTLAGTGIANGGALRNVSGSNNFGGTITLAGATRINSDSGSLVLNSTNAISGAGFTLTVGGASNTFINSAIATTTGGLNKDGTGTLRLNASNSFTGTTTVSNGTLVYGANNALGSGALTVSGGTVDINTRTDSVGAVTLINGSIIGTTGTLTGTTYSVQSGLISARLGGTAALTKTTTNTVTLTGANSYAGNTAVSAGTLAITQNAALGSTANSVTVSNNATLAMTNNFTQTRTVNLGALGGRLSVLGSSAVTNSGALVGNTPFTKDGSGKLTLTTASARTGSTNTVNAGQLWIDAADDLGVNTNATILNIRGGAFIFDDTNSVAPTLGYTINLAGGTLGGTFASAARILAGPVNVISNSFIDLADANFRGTNFDLRITNVLSGTNQLTITSGTNFGAQGVLTLTNRLNTFSGLLTVRSNVQLFAVNPSNSPLGGATIELADGGEFLLRWGTTGLVINPGVSTNGYTNANTNYFYTNSVIVSGDGVIRVDRPPAPGNQLNAVVNNTLNLNSLTMNGGRLTLASQNGYLLKFSNSTFLNGAAVFNNLTNLSLDGPIQDGTNSGALIKTGVGTLFITNQNNNPYSGGTVLNQGNILAIAGLDTNSGVFVSNILGTGTITLNGGNLLLRSDTNQTIGPGAGNDLIAGSNGVITVAQATAAGGNGRTLTLGNLYAGTNILTVNNANTYQLNFSGPMFIGGAAAISNNAPVSLDSGIVETNGSGYSFTKLGGGTLLLTNFSPNIYGGATFANQGTIRIHLNSNNAANALGSASVLTLNGGTIDVRDNGLGNVFGPGPSGYDILVNSNSGWNIDRVTAAGGTDRYITNNNLTINGGTSLTNATALTVANGSTWSEKIVGTTTLNGYSAFQINGSRSVNAGALEIIGPIVDGASPGVLIKRGAQPLGYSASNNPAFTGGTFITNGSIRWQTANLPANNLAGPIVYQFGAGNINLDGGGSFNFANNVTSNYFFSNNFIVNYQVPSSLISNYGGGTLDFTPAANNPRVTNLGSILLRGPLTVNAGGNNYSPTAPVATLQGPVTVAGGDRTLYVNTTGNGGSRITFSGNFTQDGAPRNLNLVANNNAYMVFSGTNSGFLGDFNIEPAFLGNNGKIGFVTNAALPGGKVNVSTGTLVAYSATEPTTLLNTLGTKFNFSPDSVLSFGILGSATITNDFNLSPGGPFNGGAGADIRLGSVDGGNATYSGIITPFANEYKIGGGGNTTVFNRANQFSGARMLSVGPNPYINAVAGVVVSTVQISSSNSYTGGTLINPGTTLQISVGGTNTPLGTGAVETYGTIFATGVNGGFAQAGGNSANNNISQLITHAGSQLILDNTGAPGTQNSNRWGNSTPIVLNGSTLTYQKSGNNATLVATREVAGTVSFSGGSQLSLLGNTANASVVSNSVFTLTVPDLVRIGNGTLEFNASGIAGLIGSTNTAQFIVTNSASPTLSINNGIVAPYMVSGTNVGGATFMTYVPGIGFTNAVPNVVVPTSGAFPALVGGTDNVEVQGGQSVNSAAANVYALKLTGASLLGAGAGTNVTIASGGLIFTGSSGTTNVNLIFGPTGTGEGLVFVQTGGTATLTNSLITAGHLTKFGAGTLVLQGNNPDYDGGYDVNRGILAVNTTGFGTNVTNFALGQISSANTVNLNGLVGLSFRATNNNLVYSGGKITSVDNNTIGFTFGGSNNVVQTYASGIDLVSVPGTNGVSGALGSKLLFQIQGDRTKAIIGGAVTLSNHAIVEVQNTTRPLGGGSNRISFAGGLVGNNRTLTKYGLGVLELPVDSSATFNGNIVVNGGAVAVGDNGSMGNLFSTATFNPDTVLELTPTLVNYQPVNTLVQQPGSAERWTSRLNRFSDTNSVEQFNVASNVNLQVAVNLTGLTNKTIQLNGGSIEAFNYVDDSRAATITFDDRMTIQLAADSKIGQSGVDLGRVGVVFTNNALITEINGSHSLTKIGLDTLVLGNAANNYTGGTILREGVLRLGLGNAIPAAGGLVVTNQSVLDLNSFNVTVNSLRGNGNIVNSATNFPGFTVNNTDSSSFSGQISGNLSLIKRGSGGLFLTGTNGFDGGVQINGGDVIVGIESQSLNTALGRFDNTVTIGGNARLLTAGSFTVPQNLVVDDPIFGGPKAIGTVTPGVTSTFTGNVSMLDRVVLTAATNSRVNFTGNFSQAGVTPYGLTKEGDGTVNLTGVNVYTDDTFVNAGTLLVNNGTNGTATGVGNVFVDNNSTLGGSGRIGGPVYVAINGNGGAVKPGNSAGALHMDSDLNLFGTAKMSFEIGGLIATNDYDVLTVGGTASIDGTLELTLINNFLPATNTTFKLIEYAAGGGVFANAPSSGVSRINTTDSLGSFRVSYGATSVTVDQFKLMDSDSDGIYNAWAMKYFGVLSLANGTNATDRFGDYDGDGQNNYQEFWAGTIPTDFNSAFKVMTAQVTNTANFAVTWTTAAETTFRTPVYQIQYSGDLVSWTTVVNPVITTNAGVAQWIDDGSLTGGTPPLNLPTTRFYHVNVK